MASAKLSIGSMPTAQPRIGCHCRFGGKDTPISGDPDRDTVAIQKIDDYTLEVVNKKAGKVTTSMKLAVARDGKSRTNTVTGKTATGADINNILFFDKN